MADGTTEEPFPFTEYGDYIPGIGEAWDPAAITLGGDPNTTHSAAQHFQIGGDWDNVYMGQPKTRELMMGGYNSTWGISVIPANNSTLGDDFRYWPAARNDCGYIGIEACDPSTIRTAIIDLGGCDRYESGPFGGGGTSYSADEGFWDGGAVGLGTLFNPYGQFLGTPAYNTIYYTKEEVGGVYVPNPNVFADFIGINITATATYEAAFLFYFAPGYFENCCTNMVVSSSSDAGAPEQWGTFNERGNLTFGGHYWDENGYYGCGYYTNGDNCCNSTNVCGEVFRRGGLGDFDDMEEGGVFVVGGHTADTHGDVDAGRAWLDPESAFRWTESDVYSNTEPTQTEYDPGVSFRDYPGKYGIIDELRTKRHWNIVICSGHSDKLDGGGLHGDGTEDDTELCVMPNSWGLIDDVADYMFNEGKTYAKEGDGSNEP